MHVSTMHNIEFRINTAGPMLVVYERGQNAVDGERYCILANDVILLGQRQCLCALNLLYFSRTQYIHWQTIVSFQAQLIG